MTDSLPTLGKNATPEVYEHALAVAEGYLIAAVQAQRLVTYGQLGDAIQRATGHRVDGRNWGLLLGDLVTRTHKAYGAMLSCVVISADDGRPGAGFRDLAVHLKLADEAEPESALIDRLRLRAFATLGRGAH